MCASCTWATVCMSVSKHNVNLSESQVLPVVRWGIFEVTSSERLENVNIMKYDILIFEAAGLPLYHSIHLPSCIQIAFFFSVKQCLLYNFTEGLCLSLPEKASPSPCESRLSYSPHPSSSQFAFSEAKECRLLIFTFDDILEGKVKKEKV